MYGAKRSDTLPNSYLMTPPFVTQPFTFQPVSESVVLAGLHLRF